MKSPAQTPFGAIFQNEILLNSRRVAPYVLILLFAATAVTCWGKGPAAALGWATNSDFFIARALKAFSFLYGLPIFTAVIMGDAVIRDFRAGIDPLIFSKPLNRAPYLLGKFFGNFFVLVCCMAMFPLTLLALQAVRPSGMVGQPVKVLPYFQHFFFFVVLTHLLFAACYFTAGALTRNSKVVYGLAICFYPVYIAAMLLIVRPLSIRGRSFFDLFLLSTGPSNNGFGNTAEYLNQYIVTYTPDMIANRVLVILTAAACLTWLYFRFKTTERPASAKLVHSLDPTTNGQVDNDSDSLSESAADNCDKVESPKSSGIKSRFLTSVAIFQNEVLLNTKRIAPYVVAMLCAGNALLWWGWGPATGHGLATNSDYFIAGVMPPYSFLFLPLYTALMMADPAIRDFRCGIDPLIFSKPVTRAQYLLGKFFGNFFVLACCQSAFVLTLFVLQWVPKKGVTVVQETKFLAYPKHFLVFVAISHMFLAAVYFTVGTLTRNAKIVYGLGIAFYPIYISYQTVLLSSLPWRLKLALDPLVMNRALVPNSIHRNDPSLLNQLVVVYDADLIVNRVVMILLTVGCLTILYKLFSNTERASRAKEVTVLNLSTAAEGVYYPDSSLPAGAGEFEKPNYQASAFFPRVAIPEVARVNEGIRANVNKLVAAIGIEFRLLRAERSLVVLMPLAISLSILEVAFYNLPPDVSHSAAYATNTARLLLPFLIGMTVFYIGEAMHRDREIRIEPMLWAAPAPNNVVLLSKFLATSLLLGGLILLVVIAAVAIQIVRSHTPINLLAYLRVYGIILVPGCVFLTAVSVFLNVVLRNKYLVYVVSIGAAVGLFYLYNLGHNHWTYNPMHYRLWTYADLTVSATARMILIHGLYWLLLGGLLLALAHRVFARRFGRNP